MKQSKTFQRKYKPYGRGGWFYESPRHALAAKGVKTGKLSFMDRQKLGISRAMKKHPVMSAMTAGQGATIPVAIINPPAGLVTALFGATMGATAMGPVAYGDYLEKKKGHKVPNYSITSISDKNRLDEIRNDIDSKLHEKGFTAYVSVKDGAIHLSSIVLSEKRLEEQGHNWQQKMQYGEATGAQYKRTHHLSWDDWVKVNDTVNDVLDKLGVKANVKSLGGKFDIRDKVEGRRIESDWEHLAGENVGSQMYPIPRVDYILTPGEAQGREVLSKKQLKQVPKKTQFGVMDKQGKVTKSMSIDIGKVKSDDPLAYSYGYFQAKSGQPMSKDKNLAPEYIRGYKDAKKGVVLNAGGYTPTYTTGDLPKIGGDIIGKGGATAVKLVPLATTAGLIYVGVKSFKKSMKKGKEKKKGFLFARGSVNKTYLGKLKGLSNKELLVQAQSFKVANRVYSDSNFQRNYNAVIVELKNRGLLRE